ncbi:MAG TPA: hypothetical protein GX525_01770, partial [Bacilli bacterium]|nr:hypothetical protein [Bacilli bacterium]
MNNKKVRALFSIVLSFLIVFSGLPIFPFLKENVVRADTILELTPNTFSNVYGGRVAIKFQYEDEPHPTEVSVIKPIQYLINSGTYKEDVEHVVYWDGKDTKGLVKEGTYTIKVTPTDENSMYAKEANVDIMNPEPPAPKYIHAVPDRDSTSHVIRGIAEKDTKVTLTIKYEVRKNGTQE